MKSSLKTNTLLVAAAAFAGSLSGPAFAAERYTLDPAHSFVQFKIPHLGYSMLVGRFNEIAGEFTYDAGQPDNSRIQVTVKPASVDSNHAKRDKHLREGDFLDVEKYTEATFASSGFKEEGNKATVTGNLTLRGVTRPITIDATFVGAGPDPWGGFRRGYQGTTTIGLKDFGIDYDLGPASRKVVLELFIEGIRQ